MKDKMAVFFSGLCLVHCILTPLIIGVGVMGLAGEILESEWVHIVMLFPVVALALFSLPSAYRSHRTHWPMVMAALGIAALCSAFFLSETLELWITIPAATLLIIAHSWNSILLQRQRLKTVASEV